MRLVILHVAFAPLLGGVVCDLPVLIEQNLGLGLLQALADALLDEVKRLKIVVAR